MCVHIYIYGSTHISIFLIALVSILGLGKLPYDTIPPGDCELVLLY